MSRGTLDTVSLRFVSHTGLSPISPVFPVPFCYKPPSILQSEPQMQAPGLGSSAFARRYLRNHGCFLFLRLLRCFSSPGSPRTPMYSVHGDRISPAGFPHSDIPGYNAYLRLTGAFRSLSRLSSALSARASALRPFLLNHFHSSFRYYSSRRLMLVSNIPY